MAPMNCSRLLSFWHHMLAHRCCSCCMICVLFHPSLKAACKLAKRASRQRFLQLILIALTVCTIPGNGTSICAWLISAHTFGSCAVGAEALIALAVQRPTLTTPIQNSTTSNFATNTTVKPSKSSLASHAFIPKRLRLSPPSPSEEMSFFPSPSQLESGKLLPALARPAFVANDRVSSPALLPRKAAFTRAECSADITGATMFAAASGLLIRAAVEDCKDVPERRPARCSRDIFEIVRSVSTVSMYSTEAAEHCGGLNRNCGTAISGFSKSIMTIGASVSRMVEQCGDRPGDYDRCSNQLERVAWSLDPAGSHITEAMRTCTNDPKTKVPLQDYGACVGQVLASAGYTAAAGLELRDAPSQCDTSPLGTGSQALCARNILSSLRILTLGSYKAVRAAGHCGGIRTMCGRDLTLMSAALLAVGEHGAEVDLDCGKSRQSELLCAEKATDIVKSLTVVNAKALDAAVTCQGSEAANLACGAGISKALAALALIAWQLTEVVRRCGAFFAVNNIYLCGRAIERIAGGSRIFTLGIGTASADCGFGTGKRASRPISLPRRFFT
eukprot:TRINITY_DN54755_c0_g1_i1.p1 TRINITY_DN54755_c0_g1~~TRINITY_DN54755_c0_g1_i1.p1  ORF type:complete len:559 (-),score=66.58 TRINITY_DN54755_c0_g1_i1:96-1772(-)